MGLQYTQHTRAFPTLTFASEGGLPHVKEEIHLSWEWEQDEEGINGGVSLYWYWLDGWAIHFEFFTDSIELFQRHEIQDLMEWIRPREDEEVPHWDAVILHLNTLGFTPSKYHTQHDKEA